MQELPEAYTNDRRSRMYRWFVNVLNKSVILGVIGFFVAGGYGLSQVGCNNAAVTYAHSLDPSLSCTAMQTKWVLWRGDEDVAVCRRGNDKWLCTAGNTYDSFKCDPR